MDINPLKKYTESNRAAWNEVMPKHQQAAKEKWDELFSQAGYQCLHEHEIEILKQIGIKDKDIAHLCCNNGVELLSLKNLGAATCVGFDISDEAISEAQQRAAKTMIDCTYVRSDIYEIDPAYHNSFDLIYISAGCLGWMPDLDLFFKKAAALLREHGKIFIHEIHPVAEMLPFDNSEQGGTPLLVEPYFKAEPYEDIGGLDYVGNTEYESATTQYWFVHPISRIVISLVNGGFLPEFFTEYEFDISAGHRKIEKLHAGIPLSFILTGKLISQSPQNRDFEYQD